MHLYHSLAVLAIFLFLALPGYASCPYGEALWNKKDYARAEKYYISCAKSNDSLALYRLGLIYKNGYIEQKTDIVKALSFLRFSAENGYAPAQRELATSLLKLEQDEQGSKIVEEYQGKIQQSSGKTRILGNASQKDLTPYAWILLAAEKAENKWYYPSEALSDDKAVQMVQETHVGPDVKKAAIAEAGEWKMKKLRSAAKEILPKDEYSSFENAVFSGQATSASRASAIGYLKQKIEERKK